MLVGILDTMETRQGQRSQVRARSSGCPVETSSLPAQAPPKSEQLRVDTKVQIVLSSN